MQRWNGTRIRDEGSRDVAQASRLHLVEKGLTSFLILLVLIAWSGCQSPEPPPAPPPTATPPAIPAPPPAPAPEPARPPDELVTAGNPPVRVRLFHGVREVSIQSGTSLHINHEGGAVDLPSHSWTVTLGQATPPRQHFHVFLKTFKPHETDAMHAYLAQWTAQGYPAKAIPMGSRYRTEAGHILDGREQWISLQRFERESQAVALKAGLERDNQWSWIRPETILPGSGTVSAKSADGHTMSWNLPVHIMSSSPIRVAHSGDRTGKTYIGEVSLAVEPDSTLGVYETLPVEEYLAGVLPAEMPALWPAEALKAQAIAARSDVLGHLALKHVLAGFNFTNSEGDRMYGGYSGRHPASDAAVAATRGRVLSDGVRIIPAVFSSNCGGWSEDNDAVWSSPPDMSLRGVADFPKGAAPAAPSANIARWLQQQPRAYCSGDDKGFRWSRRLTVAEVTRSVNQHHNVGTVRAIEPGERGVSGRLKSVTVTGSQGKVTIRKELPIRQAFGGLPSAMVLIRAESGASGPVAFTFVGGGRGHGVGLCQHGARGMALAGAGYQDIVLHYFGSALLETVQ